MNCQLYRICSGGSGGGRVRATTPPGLVWRGGAGAARTTTRSGGSLRCVSDAAIRRVRMTSTRNSPWLSSTLSSLIPRNRRPSAGIVSGTVWSPIPNGWHVADATDQRAREHLRHRAARHAGPSSIRRASPGRCRRTTAGPRRVELNVHALTPAHGDAGVGPARGGRDAERRCPAPGVRRHGGRGRARSGRPGHVDRAEVGRGEVAGARRQAGRS